MSVNENPATSAAGDDSSTSDILDLRNDEGWEDVEADHIDESFVSLFDGETFPKLTDMWTYCREKYAFDVWQLQRQYGEGKPHPSLCGTKISQIWTSWGLSGW